MSAPTATVLVASDLDRTLIYSRAAGGASAEREGPLHCVERYRDQDASFMTGAAVAAVEDVGREAVLVPVTTRTREQLGRVRLPGASRYAVAANGGHLLVDGEPDPGWARRVADTLQAGGVPVQTAHEQLLAVMQPGWTLSVRVADDLFCYAVVDVAAMPDDVVPALSRWAGTRGWRVSMQGRKVYVVPAGLTKSAAVRELARRLGTDVLLGAGDSLLDVDLLEAADAGVRPAHGELHETGWTAPHVDTTARSGLLGGQDVATWLLARVRATTGRAAR